VMEKFSQYETLSESLDRLGALMGRLEQDMEINHLEILSQIDEINDRIKLLESEGKKPVAESAQYEYITAILRKNAGKFVRGIGGESAMAAARQKANPPADYWWWYLDQYILQQRRATLKKFLVGVSIVVVAFFILSAIYNRFLAPDPATQARITHTMLSDTKINQGDFAGALTEIDQALKYSPKDTDLLLTKGVLLQKFGKEEDATKIFTQVEDLMKNQVTFFTNRSLVYLKIGDPQRGLLDAQEALKINPKSPEAYFYMAKSLEDLNQIPKAIEAYQTASSLASDQGKSELEAVIRMNLGGAMQKGGMPGDNSSITPTASP
jgi:tetratricopeptide (TPR) repeat protein